MIKYIFILFSIYFLLINFSFAVDLSFPSQTLPPIIKCTNFSECIWIFFAQALRVIVVLATALAVIFIAWAGIVYITKSTQKEVHEEIKKRLIWAVVGLIVALVSFSFVRMLEIWIIRSISLSPVIEIFLPINITFAQITEQSPPERISCGGVSLPSALEEVVSSSQNIWKVCILFYLLRILSFLYVLSLALGVIFLTWAGVLYITQPEKAKEIHSRLKWGIIGVTLSILSFSIVKIIDIFFSNIGK